MEITIHEEKISLLTFHGKKKGRSRITKIPFTTLLFTYNFLCCCHDTWQFFNVYCFGGAFREKPFLTTVKLYRSHNYEYNDDNKVKNFQFSLQNGLSSLRTSLVASEIFRKNRELSENGRKFLDILEKIIWLFAPFLSLSGKNLMLLWIFLLLLVLKYLKFILF